MSIEELARITPVSPPIVKRKTNPRAHNIGVSNFISVPCIVASHLKILIPVGTAIAIVATAKIELATGPSPTVNMWWAQTMNPKKAISMVAKTMAV